MLNIHWGGKVLESVDVEQDLEVVIQNDLKVSQQCSKVVKTANKILGMIYRTFQYKSEDIMLRLYKSFVSEATFGVLRVGMEAPFVRRHCPY